jgi:catechol 2,3-dioxygenase-like lactoylglutathione lyase family enzyme
MFADSLAFSGFSVDDIDQARQFYADTLGLTVTEASGRLTLQIAGDRPTLVYPSPNHVPATYTILNFPVSDIDAAVDELTARGVTMQRYADMDGFDDKGIYRARGPLIAWFKDPAGNTLSVIEQ